MTHRPLTYYRAGHYYRAGYSAGRAGKRNCAAQLRNYEGSIHYNRGYTTGRAARLAETKNATS